MSYLSIYVLGTVFVQLAMGLNAFITAQGFAKIGMYSVLVGAALATIISQAVSAAWVIRFLCGKETG